MTFPIPRDALHMGAILLGKTRSGKSSTLRFCVEAIDHDQERYCILTPKDDWWGLKLGADGKSPGCPVVLVGGEHADIPVNEHAGRQIGELVASGNRPCVITVAEMSIAGRSRFFTEFAETLFKTNRGRLYLVIDECHNFAPKGKLFDIADARMLHWANRLASEGLGRGITLLSASQRPQKVHNDYLTSHETLIAKKVNHSADRRAVQDWIDGCGDPAVGKELVRTIADLSRAEAWVWCPEVKFGPERVTFPFFKTYDSFKPQPVGGVKLKGWAEVDLAEVKAKLSGLVEEAKQNDPKALKAEIARLTSELKKKAPEATPMRNEQDIVIAEEMARADGFRTGFEYAKQKAGSAMIQTYTDAIDSAIKALEVDSSEVMRSIVAPDAPQAQKGARIIPQNIPAPRSASVRSTEIQAASSQVNHVPADGLSGPAQRILDAMRELEAMGSPSPPREILGFMSGYSNLNSKGFVNAIGSLRTAEMITYPSAGTAALTDAGRRAGRKPEGRITTQAIRQRIVEMLGGASARILDPLIGNYPGSITREELAKFAGYGNLNSKGFVNAIGRLRTLGFIAYPSTGQVVATELLFP